jgi:hypothetical protein
MNRHLISRWLIALGLAGALMASLGAQEPSKSAPPKQQPAASDTPVAVTVEGCLRHEEDVPGRKPNVAEKAGVTQDYVLTDIKLVKGSVPALSGGGKPGEAVGTAGVSKMLDVEGLTGDELKKHAGQRVQIDGMIDPKDVREHQGKIDDLPDIDGKAIRSVSGTCAPAK